MRTVIVTGASGGIGAAIAVRLAVPGRRLVLQGRRREALDDVTVEVRRRGAEAEAVAVDLTSPQGPSKVIAAAAGEPILALVNNAGSAVVKPVEEISLEEWQASLALNLTAPFSLVREALPFLSTGSAIVNVLSVAARQAFAGWSAYCAAKSGLDGFSRALREELRPRGIRVINVYPAATDTPLWDGVSGTWARERMLRPADVAEAVAFALTSPPRVEVGGIELGDVSGAL